MPRKATTSWSRAGQLENRDWRLAIAGPTDRSPQALTALQAAIDDTGLGPRIALAGAVDRGAAGRFYDASADLFVMPSLYEGYGMVLAEAMARGLPIVCTTGGAAADTVPDDAASRCRRATKTRSASAIRRVLARNRPAAPKAWRDAAWAAGQKLPRWDDTARDRRRHRGGLRHDRIRSRSWLDLREPADHRSRSEELARCSSQAFRRLAADHGRGSGLRHRLQPARHGTAARRRSSIGRWSTTTRACSTRPSNACRVGRPGRAQDGQLVLFKGAKRITVRLRRADLARDLERVLHRKADLVTASALFDLGSADFIAEVAAEVVRCRAAFYTVLTYDGQQRWTPEHERRRGLASAFHAHQTRDKGFGDAAGPMAPALLSAAFDAAGYSVSEGDSAWRLEAGDETLIAALVPGFANAVRETELVPEEKIGAWLKIQRAGALVGHTDTLALPP